MMSSPTAADTSAALSQALVWLDRCAARGAPVEMMAAHARLAHCYADAGALGTAEAYLEQALRWSNWLGAVDGQVDLLCEMAEVAARNAEQLERAQRGSGQTARRRARLHASTSSQLAAHVADPCWEITVLLRASDVLDRCGSRDEAVKLQSRAVRLMGEQAAADA